MIKVIKGFWARWFAFRPISYGPYRRVVECPEAAAPGVIECINHHMNKRHPELPGVLFSANAEAGMTWKAVG